MTIRKIEKVASKLPLQGKKVPAFYLKEFNAMQSVMIKVRLKLLFLLCVSLYLIACTLDYFLTRRITLHARNPYEFLVVFGLTGAAILIFYAMDKNRSEQASKIAAFLFIGLILAFITLVYLLYPQYLDSSSTLYLFAFFLVSITIPWAAEETIVIALLFLASYVFLFNHNRYLTLEPLRQAFSESSFAWGMVLFALSLVLCFVVRRKEMERDIENFILFKDITAKNKQMSQELELATRVHKTLVPKSMITETMDVAVMYLPMSYMGGDYANFVWVHKNKVIFIICDVTGHGVSAALLVNRIHLEFERMAKDDTAPGQLLKELNDFIVDDFKETRMFLSAFACAMDFGRMTLTYSNRGHPAPYLYRREERSLVALPAHATLLGIPGLQEDVRESTLKFAKGDKLFLFTDGVTEARSKNGEVFGQKRLEDFLRQNNALPPSQFNNLLFKSLSDFCQENFADDIFTITADVTRGSLWQEMAKFSLFKKDGA